MLKIQYFNGVQIHVVDSILDDNTFKNQNNVPYYTAATAHYLRSSFTKDFVANAH